jgi:hypothetical protein
MEDRHTVLGIIIQAHLFNSPRKVDEWVDNRRHLHTDGYFVINICWIEGR